MTKPNYVYVASSWRNPIQVAVCKALEVSGIDHYDFRNPPTNSAFHWSEVMPSYRRGGHVGGIEQRVPVEEYVDGLANPLSVQGFESDMEALRKADTVALILLCGKSAHLELGYAVGAGKETVIMLDGDTVIPELMYKMVNHISTDLFDLLGWLGVED